MADDLHAAVVHVKHQFQNPTRPLSRLPLDVDVDALARGVGHRWRDRKLTPSVTVWLFLLQVLHGNTAITALKHLGGIVMQAGSYCEARMRLPLELFTALFDAVSRAASAQTQS